MAALLLFITFLFCHKISAQEYEIFWKSESNGVHVVDDAFAKHKGQLRNLVQVFKEMNWRFTVDEDLGQNENNLQSVKIGFKTMKQGTLKNQKATKKLGKLIKDLYGFSKVEAVTAQGRMIERGDFNPVIQECTSNASKIIALLILTKKWKKNDYGEVTIYDKNGDVLKSIHPRFGRVVLIPCGVQFKISPPCINVEGRHYFLTAEFGDGTAKVQAKESRRRKSFASLSEFFRSRYDMDTANYQSIDAEKHVTRKFFTKEGKRVFVYDNTISFDNVDILRDYIMNHAEYYENPVSDKGADNVKWIISLDDPGFVDGPIWHIIKQLLVHIAGKEFYPYDLACNHVRRTDNTFNHKDNYEKANEYTVLIYLNPDWTENHYGETTFLDNNEIIAAVRPRYGRVVIFHGTIDHSAHPSCPELPGARYSFAIKAAATKELAMKRMLAQEAQGFSYADIVAKLNRAKTSGGRAQKEFANKALKRLQSGGLLGEDFTQTLIAFMQRK